MQMVEIKPAFDLTDFYIDFFEKGVIAFDGVDLLKDVALKPLVELSSRFPDGSLLTDGGCANYERNAEDDIVIHALRDKLLELGLPLNPTSLKFHFVEYRTNPDVFKWHNDNGSHFSDHNVTINCFFDDVCENTGGRFDVCSYDSSIAGTPNDHAKMHSLFPKKFTVVVFNQNRDFIHKVTPTTKLRRLLSYAGSLL